MTAKSQAVVILKIEARSANSKKFQVAIPSVADTLLGLGWNQNHITLVNLRSWFCPDFYQALAFADNVTFECAIQPVPASTIAWLHPGQRNGNVGILGAVRNFYDEASFLEIEFFVPIAGSDSVGHGVAVEYFFPA